MNTEETSGNIFTYIKAPVLQMQRCNNKRKKWARVKIKLIENCHLLQETNFVWDWFYCYWLLYELWWVKAWDKGVIQIFIAKNF